MAFRICEEAGNDQALAHDAEPRPEAAALCPYGSRWE